MQQRENFFLEAFSPDETTAHPRNVLQDNRSMLLEELGLGQTANIVLFYWGGEVCLYSKESQLKPVP